MNLLLAINLKKSLSRYETSQSSGGLNSMSYGFISQSNDGELQYGAYYTMLFA